MQRAVATVLALGAGVADDELRIAPGVRPEGDPGGVQDVRDLRADDLAASGRRRVGDQLHRSRDGS
jgi:hypothetical protein